MEVSLEQRPPDDSAAETRADELIKLIRKLRWAGMDKEAERLLKELQSERGEAAESVIATPRETD